MTANTEGVDTKNRTYYFFNDMINIKDLDANLLKIDKKSYKGIDISYIGYSTIKKNYEYENIHCVYPLYLIIHSVTIFNSWFDRQIWRSLVRN